MTVNEHINGPSDDLRERVRDTTINDTTLLSTDYCNHLNEVVMLIGMIGAVGDAADMLAEVREWKPLTYAEHFEASGLSIGPLAIEAYDICETKYREAFDTTLEKFNQRVIAGCSELADVIEGGDAEHIAFNANALSMELQAVIDQLGGIIHGAATTDAVDDADGLSQDDIDALF
jgi:hypothetical protein